MACSLDFYNKLDAEKRLENSTHQVGGDHMVDSLQRKSWEPCQPPPAPSRLSQPYDLFLEACCRPIYLAPVNFCQRFRVEPWQVCDMSVG